MQRGSLIALDGIGIPIHLQLRRRIGRIGGIQNAVLIQRHGLQIENVGGGGALRHILVKDLLSQNLIILSASRIYQQILGIDIQLFHEVAGVSLAVWRSGSIVHIVFRTRTAGIFRLRSCKSRSLIRNNDLHAAHAGIIIFRIIEHAVDHCIICQRKDVGGYGCTRHDIGIVAKNLEGADGRVGPAAVRLDLFAFSAEYWQDGCIQVILLAVNLPRNVAGNIGGTVPQFFRSDLFFRLRIHI